MTDKDREVAVDLKRRLSDAVDLIDFRVFGSRARGDAAEFSDMDVFIEVEHLSKQIKAEIRDIAWEVGMENSLYISPIIFTRTEIEDSPLRSSFIVSNIRDEGVTI